MKIEDNVKIATAEVEDTIIENVETNGVEEDTQEENLVENEEVQKVKKDYHRLETIIVPDENDERLIIAGPRGVTKHQMIPAIQRNIDKPENIKRLAADYPATFSGSLRYVKKNIRDAVEEILGKNENEDPVEKIELINKLKPSRKGITYNQIIIALENACDEKNYVMIQQIRKYFPEQFQGSLRYMAKKYHEAIETALEIEDKQDVSVKKLAVRKG